MQTHSPWHSPSGLSPFCRSSSRLMWNESVYSPVSVDTLRSFTFFLAGLLGVHTALESPSTTAAPSLTRVRVQLNFVFPDFTEVLTVSDMARTLCRAERKMQREAVEHKPILSLLPM